MVAVINTGNSISRTLNYNEQKVQEGKAKCIGAVNYPKDPDQLNFHEKLNMLKRQAELNENVKRNSVHISLNFDPSDRLDAEKMLSIAHSYMTEIGFGNQPYLIYQHFDAGHPHLHLVSFKVRNDGSRIDMQNIGRNQSRKACESLEKAYKLTVAKGRKQTITKSANTIEVARYGKSETRRAISNVLEKVLPQYLYTSLPELNAVLKQYNVAVDGCNTNSRTFRNNGLFYRLLDSKGKPVGIPIKASLFYNNPGLKFLTERFNENEYKKLPFKSRIKNAVNIAFTKNKILI
ncbi:relaxase/mobilization nuclease domain-containing protein [Danxiaibacter flavus]|uniref:Relaxase/mobilization nuclease domain-containing protein n=1 Tax=Danxiaibacter flavus TaxID=3049108 RepID=A0ABV3ZLQ8_9BACT|nr:relaxase/mobilization nuclease domain-containing protein [Chitinophagaceae bacterium DXS]